MSTAFVNFLQTPTDENSKAAVLLPAIIQGLQLAYMPKKLNADAKQAQLKNSLMEIQRKYAEPTAQANISSKKAYTNLIGQQAQYMPLNELIKASDNQRTNSRFGSAYQLQKALSAMPPAARDAWIANNKDAYISSLDAIGNDLNKPQTTTNNLLNQLIQKLIGGNTIQSSNHNQSIDKPIFDLSVGSKIPFQLASNITDQEIENSPYTISHDQAQAIAPIMENNTARTFNTGTQGINNIDLATKMSANKELTTGKARTQAEAAQNIDNFLKDNQADFSRSFKNITKYAGLIGKGKLGLDQLKSVNPQAFQDYQQFTGQFIPNMANMVTQMEGTSIAPDKQKDIREMFDKGVKSLTTDPKSALNYINNSMKMISEISKQRIKTAEPLFKNTYSQTSGYNGIPSPYISFNENSHNIVPNNSLISVVSSDGKQRGKIPIKRLSEFLKDHPEFRSMS